ncbi:MAG: hypothetical protein CMO55_09275 [Verrucomicrobiales bacterium]|nr:hypothetical protein [Verrucomicrobiales bacterium]
MLPAAAWICSLIGLGLTYITLLGLGMSTVPGRLSGTAALGLAILPLLALLATGTGLMKTFQAQQQVKGVLIYLIPLLASLFCLYGIASSYKPAKKKNTLSYTNRTTYHREEGAAPHYQFEVRPLLPGPEEGSTEVKDYRSDETYHVGKEIILTGDDIDVTWSGGPYGRDKYYIGIRIVMDRREHLKEVSMRDSGNKWAILLDGKVLSTPTLMEPLREEITFEDNFDAREAEMFAKGMVKPF